MGSASNSMVLHNREPLQLLVNSFGLQQLQLYSELHNKPNSKPHSGRCSKIRYHCYLKGKKAAQTMGSLDLDRQKQAESQKENGRETIRWGN